MQNKNTMTPTIDASAISTPKNIATPVAMAPAATEPKKVPSMARRIPPRNTTSSAPQPIEFSMLMPDEAPPLLGLASGNSSPSIILMMRSTPALTPALKSPCLNGATMYLSMMRLAMASGNAPSSPRPTSIRSLRSSLAIKSSTPSSTPLRPSFHCSATRIPYCSTVSGCVVGTSNTAS